MTATMLAVLDDIESSASYSYDRGMGRTPDGRLIIYLPTAGRLAAPDVATSPLAG